MTTASYALGAHPLRALTDALLRASSALARHEREVVEYEERLSATRRMLESAGYLRDALPTRTVPEQRTRRPRVRLARFRVAVKAHLDDFPNRLTWGDNAAG